MEDEVPQPAAREEVSFWALAAVLCAACPFMSIIGVVMATVALLDIRKRPNRAGRGFAIGALAVSSVVTAGWGVFAVYWYANAHRPMKYGPVAALRAGQAGDLVAFREAFVDGGSPDEQDAAAFLAAVTGRYGRLLATSQRPDDGSAAARNTDLRRVWIPYAFQFERGLQGADAQFISMVPGQGLMLKFAWVAIRDPDLGDLVYPPQAADAADAPPPEPVGPIPAPHKTPAPQEQPRG